MLGNEWISISPHNSALGLMSWVFGPPSRSYDGPYPSKEQALAILSEATEVAMPDILSDRIPCGPDVCLLEEGVGPALVSGLGFYPLDKPDDSDEDQIKISAVFYQERCLVLRIRQKRNYLDYLLLIDRTKGKPFAYFHILKEGQPRMGRNYHPVNYYDPEYLHALQGAADKGDMESLKRLLDRGVEIDLQTDTGGTALLTAVYRGQAHAVSFLLARGADVNKADNSGHTPLFHLDIDDGTMCALLLKHGADITLRDWWGNTPLLHTVSHGNPDVVEKLLAAGADRNDTDRDGKDAWAMARERKNPRIIELLKKKGKEK